MKNIILFLLLLTSSASYAGLNGFTIHSRANCYNNESISWWYNHPLNLKTISAHYDAGLLRHTVVTSWDKTWRSAAVHFGEGIYTYNWSATGYHYGLDSKNNVILYGIESVQDCSIYDGWWDVK